MAEEEAVLVGRIVLKSGRLKEVEAALVRENGV
jgi:hypothetical protein